jgi:hypothetical protein
MASFEWEMSVASTDERNFSVTSDRFNTWAKSRLLPIYLNCIEGSVHLPDGAISERMRDDGDALPVMGQIYHFFWCEYSRVRLGWWVRPDDEHVSSCSRYLDSREDSNAEDTVTQITMEVVVCHHDCIHPTISSHRSQQAETNRIQWCRGPRKRMEKSDVRVEIDGVHSLRSQR